MQRVRLRAAGGRHVYAPRAHGPTPRSRRGPKLDAPGPKPRDAGKQTPGWRHAHVQRAAAGRHGPRQPTRGVLRAHVRVACVHVCAGQSAASAAPLKTTSPSSAPSGRASPTAFSDKLARRRQQFHPAESSACDHGVVWCRSWPCSAGLSASCVRADGMERIDAVCVQCGAGRAWRGCQPGRTLTSMCECAFDWCGPSWSMVWGRAYLARPHARVRAGLTFVWEASAKS